MALVAFDAKRIVWKKTDSTAARVSVITEFVCRDKQDKQLLADILLLLMRNRDALLSAKDFREIRATHKLTKTKFWHTMRRLEKMGIIRISVTGSGYYASPRFAKALRKVARAYWKLMK